MEAGSSPNGQLQGATSLELGSDVGEDKPSAAVGHLTDSVLIHIRARCLLWLTCSMW